MSIVSVSFRSVGNSVKCIEVEKSNWFLCVDYIMVICFGWKLLMCFVGLIIGLVLIILVFFMYI